MRKLLITALPCLAAILLAGIAVAQDTPAASAAKPAKPAQSTPSSTAKTPAAKSSTSTAAKPAAKPATGVALTTQKQKNSYALGMSIGAGLKKQGLSSSVDAAVAARGFRDAMAGSKTLLTEDEMKAALQQLRTQVMAASEAKAHEAAAPNRKAGEEFLAANKTKEGVKALPDGLQYKILTEGSGPKPTATDTVTVNYRGTLLDGKEFDSSYKRGQPASFEVGGVIKGWTEALQLMPVGSKWELFIPADLAYGDNPRPGGDIKPGDTLIFEVELLSIGEKK